MFAKNYLKGGVGQKRKRTSFLEMIMEDEPYLKDYARQRALVNVDMRRRMTKRFRKAADFEIKNLAK